MVTKTNPIFAHAMIVIMEVGDTRLYKERWKAVEEIEQQELRAVTPEQHWQKLNAIVRFAIETGMEIDNTDGEMEVFLRWAKLKARYEVGQSLEPFRAAIESLQHLLHKFTQSPKFREAG